MTGCGVSGCHRPKGRPAGCAACRQCAGEKLPGRRHKVLALCQRHADAVFGSEDPLRRRLDAKTQRDIVNGWLSAMTILAHGVGRPPEELPAEIAAVNDIGTETIRLVSPMMPARLATCRRQTVPRAGPAAARLCCTPWSPRSCSAGAPPPAHIRTAPGGNERARGQLTPKTVSLWAEGRVRPGRFVHQTHEMADKPSGPDLVIRTRSGDMTGRDQDRVLVAELTGEAARRRVGVGGCLTRRPGRPGGGRQPVGAFELFRGDTTGADALPDWYRPHIARPGPPLPPPRPRCGSGTRAGHTSPAT